MKETFGEGIRGQVFVSGVTYDESAGADAIEVAVPLMAATEDSVVGDHRHS